MMDGSEPLSLEFSTDASAAAVERAGVGPDEFRAAFGESLQRTLDLSTWPPGGDLAPVYERLIAEVADAVRQEERVRDPFRREVFPRIVQRPAAPKGAGLYRAKPSTIERVHRGLLFRGAVEACNGTTQ